MKTKSIIILVASLVITLLAFIFIKIQLRYDETSRYRIDYAAQANLKYLEYKSLLVDAVQQYINDKAPSSNLTAFNLVEKCLEYDIDIIFVLAQTQAESNFGTKGLASKTNSAWNMGAFDGRSYDKILGIYKYSHPDLSLEPYLKTLKNSYLVGKIEEDLMTPGGFVNTQGKRYATDENYEKKLHSIYDNIVDSTEINSLIQMSNYWKVRSNN